MRLSLYRDYIHKHTGETFCITELEVDCVHVRVVDYNIPYSDRVTYKYSKKLFLLMFTEKG